MQRSLETMLGMQERMNRRVHPAWRDQGFAWYRATWVECAELLDHVGYKWWKRQAPAMEHVRLEVVDIWHFGLSAMLVDEPDHPALAAAIAAEVAARTPATGEVREAVEALAAHALTTHGFSVPAFWDLMLAAGLDFDDLYRAYVGKNVLNFFRQDHGYREGHYDKTWAGREDNEHLHEIANAMDSAAADFPDRLYAALGERYAARG